MACLRREDSGRSGFFISCINVAVADLAIAATGSIAKRFRPAEQGGLAVHAQCPVECLARLSEDGPLHRLDAAQTMELV